MAAVDHPVCLKILKDIFPISSCKDVKRLCLGRARQRKYYLYFMKSIDTELVLSVEVFILSGTPNYRALKSDSPR